ncbi:MAG: hypothetical protein ACOYNC_04180 [Bacteroidales bacterium]
MNRKAVVVLGMHRSGTSTASGILSAIGFDLGRAVIGANESNPRGFYENYRIMMFNETLFRSMKVDWHNTQGVPENWWNTAVIKNEIPGLKALILDDFMPGNTLLFKDPRMCILLPVYLEAFAELQIDPVFVITYRNPDEVAASLKKRDGFPLNKSIRIWLDHMLKAERYSRGFPRIFADYHSILADPLAVLAKIEQTLSLDVHLLVSEREKITQFVEPELNHSQPQPLSSVGQNQYETYVFQLFKNAASSSLSNIDEDELDHFAEEFYLNLSLGNWPKISVIINGGKDPESLETTINSVVRQDYPNMETILYYQSSESETIRVIDKYRYLLSYCICIDESATATQENGSIGIASGEWVIILNSGDTLISSDALRKMMKSGSLEDNLTWHEFIQSGAGPQCVKLNS